MPKWLTRNTSLKLRFEELSHQAAAVCEPNYICKGDAIDMSAKGQ